jgi:hypothetical protein
MIVKNVSLKMSYNTIQKIYSINSGVESNEYEIVHKLNNLMYEVIEMPDDEVILECNYIPHSWQSMKFELYK